MQFKHTLSKNLLYWEAPCFPIFAWWSTFHDIFLVGLCGDMDDMRPHNDIDDNHDDDTEIARECQALC